MGMGSVTFILLLELLAPPRFGWVDAGLEQQNRIAVRIDSVPTDTSEGFSAAHVAVPPQPRGQRRYTLWLSRWDCEEGTRRRTARIDYSQRQTQSNRGHKSQSGDRINMRVAPGTRPQSQRRRPVVNAIKLSTN